MSIKQLKKALRGANRDEFEVGAVLRWTSSERYSYAAIKTPVGWFTTARDENPFVAQRLTYDELVEVLRAADVSDVEAATTWEGVS